MGLLATFKITNDVKTTRLEFRAELKEEVRAICDKIKSLNERMVAIEADLSEFVLPKEVVDPYFPQLWKIVYSTTHHKNTNLVWN